MPTLEALRIALREIADHKLRSFFTLLGIIVSVAFLVAVVAIIQGMNAYVEENLAGAIVGRNAFQIRQIPIGVGLVDDEELDALQRRPIIRPEEMSFVERALPDAMAISRRAWPAPRSDIRWRNRTVGAIQVFGATPAFHVVQDYEAAFGRFLTEIDMRERRPVAVLGWQVAENLFGNPVTGLDRTIRVGRTEVRVVGVVAEKGNVLGQSQDDFALVPISLFEGMYGRRRTMVISVKMAEAADVAGAMQRAEEAMRVARRLRPGQANNFTIDTAEGLISFWDNLTRVIFAVVPAVVAIGVVVGGIVIMNIMLMSVQERTREIGIRKSVGARRRDIRRQFLAETVTLAVLGGITGIAVGTAMAQLVAIVSPLPARVTWWSITLALTLGATTGVIFGVYPATRASKLDPVVAMRAE